MPLKVTVAQKKPEAFTIAPEGSIDSDTFPELEKAVRSAIDQKAKVIMFDMQRVKYISSMGLSVIFKAKKLLSGNNGEIMIVNLQPQIKNIFDLVKVIPEWIFENMQEADESLDAFLAKRQNLSE
ncbi:MAG: STAS domain-containing protein [Candidatus Omnitrophota bacterium]